MYFKSLRKIVIAVAVIFIITVVSLLILKATTYDEMPTEERDSGGNINMNIFEASDYDYILMYGDTRLWDDEKNLSIDLDGDGASEEFVISKGTKDDVILKGIRRNSSNGKISETEFWSSSFSGLLPASLKKRNGISDNCFIQISCCDIDEDGIKEVLISAGDKQEANVTVVYEYSNIEEMPFQYCDYIRSGLVVRYVGGGTIRAYFKNVQDGKYDTYIYKDEKLTRITINQ